MQQLKRVGDPAALKTELAAVRQALSTAQTEIALLKEQLAQRDQNSFDSERGVGIHFRGSYVHVQPIGPHLTLKTLSTLDYVLTTPRTGFDRFFGYLLGRSNWLERDVNVFVTPLYSTNEKDYTKLTDPEKVRMLRRIAKAHRPGGEIAAHNILAETRRQLENKSKTPVLLPIRPTQIPHMR